MVTRLYVSNFSSSIDVTTLETIDLTRGSNNSFSLDLNTDGRRSNLRISTKVIMENISSSQISLKTLDEQLSILAIT